MSHRSAVSFLARKRRSTQSTVGFCGTVHEIPTHPALLTQAMIGDIWRYNSISQSVALRDPKSLSGIVVQLITPNRSSTIAPAIFLSS